MVGFERWNDIYVVRSSESRVFIITDEPDIVNVKQC